MNAPSNVWIAPDGRLLGEVGPGDPSLPCIDVSVCATAEAADHAEAALRAGLLPDLPTLRAGPELTLHRRRDLSTAGLHARRS